MYRINLLSLTVPAKINATVPIKRNVPSTLRILQKTENPKGNPLLVLIKNFADNPQKLQEELKKLINEGQEKVCRYLLGILELHDKNTAHHMRGVSRIAAKFAKEIGLSPEKTQEIKVAALVHDMGKLFTPLKILKNPNSLNPSQKKVMDKHALRTKQLLDQLGITKDSFFKNAADLAEKHHTSVDKLSLSRNKTIEEEILELSDVFSALTIKRDYKRPLPPKKALEVMRSMQEKQKTWDPTFFEKFINFVEKTYYKKQFA